MVYNYKIFESIIEKRKIAGQNIPLSVKIASVCFKNKLFIFIINIVEFLLGKLLNFPIPIINDLIVVSICNFPGPPKYLGPYLRSIYFKDRLKFLGKNVVFEEDVKIINPHNVEIHDNSYISKGVIISAGNVSTFERRIISDCREDIIKEGHLIISKNCIISPYCSIGAHGGLLIEQNVGIGPNCSIFSLAHVSMKPHISLKRTMHIGANSAIGTNSSLICIKNVPKNTYIKPNSFISSGILKNKQENKEEYDE